ncbi:hypothetical protein BCI9360_03600 [Bacillus sp. CECT 9360]|nr:hypothetical protein BCI9360_03600 [Bacillus sp. CECT 9360]
MMQIDYKINFNYKIPAWLQKRISGYKSLCSSYKMMQIGYKIKILATKIQRGYKNGFPATKVCVPATK